AGAREAALAARRSNPQVRSRAGSGSDRGAGRALRICAAGAGAGRAYGGGAGAGASQAGGSGSRRLAAGRPAAPAHHDRAVGGAAPAGGKGAGPASAQMGYLVAATKPVARVSIDGRETGRWTPVPSGNPIALPAGAHTIVFETADGKRHEEKLQIEPGKTSRMVRELPR